MLLYKFKGYKVYVEWNEYFPKTLQDSYYVLYNYYNFYNLVTFSVIRFDRVRKTKQYFYPSRRLSLVELLVSHDETESSKILSTRETQFNITDWGSCVSYGTLVIWQNCKKVSTRDEGKTLIWSVFFGTTDSIFFSPPDYQYTSVFVYREGQKYVSRSGINNVER